MQALPFWGKCLFWRALLASPLGLGAWGPRAYPAFPLKSCTPSFVRRSRWEN
jgi:hypothetical protein